MTGNQKEIQLRGKISQITLPFIVLECEKERQRTQHSHLQIILSLRLNNLMTKLFLPSSDGFLPSQHLHLLVTSLGSCLCWILFCCQSSDSDSLLHEKDPPALHLVQWSSQMCVCGAWNTAQMHQLWVLWVATGFSCTNNIERVQIWQMWLEDVPGEVFPTCSIGESCEACQKCALKMHSWWKR